MRHVLLIVFVLAGCSGSDSAPDAAATEPVAAPVTIVDLDGAPLANMMPIAATSPNAFEEPVAVGPPTDAQGNSAFAIPSDQHLFVRAWDPELNFFANNFYEIDPGPAAQTEPMTLVMVPGAQLDAELVAADGTTVAGAAVTILMAHPTMGPWWPDTATCDSDGRVHFSALPPGQFQVKISTETGLSAFVQEVALPPKGHVNLGQLVLQEKVSSDR